MFIKGKTKLEIAKIIIAIIETKNKIELLLEITKYGAKVIIVQIVQIGKSVDKSFFVE